MFGVSCVSQSENSIEAVEEVIRNVQTGMGDRPVDLVMIFASFPSLESVDEAVERFQKEFGEAKVIGCTGCGVIGQNEEIEDQPAISCLAMNLPDVTMSPVHLGPEDLRGEPADLGRRVAESLGERRPEVMLLLADPYTTPVTELLTGIETTFPGLPVVGGMASLAHVAQGNRLIAGGESLEQGCVGLAFYGNIRADTTVSQGCRPIGRAYKITECIANMIFQLDGKGVTEQVNQMIQSLDDETRKLLRKGLFVGIVVHKDEAQMFGRGHFLIRGVMGFDQQRDAMIIGDNVEVGTTIQFHVRDADTATEDLELTLTPQQFDEDIQGALVFSCNGRGTHLYNRPDGDISTIQKVLGGEVPAAGFFCAGEIGPIGLKNFLHGHTVSMLLFRPKKPA
jgi:small ligand-binding sensory domain FIST